MAEETPDAPLGSTPVLRWEPSPEPTLNAVADPPATSVAVEPEPETPEAPVEASDEIPPETPEAGEEGEDDAPTEPQTSRRPIRERLSELAQQRNAEREQRLAAEIARAKAEGRAEALAELYHQQALQTPQGQQEPAPPPPPELPAYPQEAAYPTAEAYQQAMQAYIASMIQVGVQQGIAQHQQVTARQAALAQARQRYPNFDQLIAQARVPVNPYLTQAIQDAPDWPLVMAHLAQHPDEATALMAVDRPGAYAAVARIQAQLNAPAAPVSDVPDPSPVPRLPAPPPVAPPRSRSVPAARTYEEMTFMEFMRARNKEEQEARRTM